MKEKFDYILLPPDGFHITLRNRLVDAHRFMQDMIEVVDRIKQPEDRMVVKYRSWNHQSNFPYHGETRGGHVALLDLCDEETVVVGFPGSAALECLLNDIHFYAFWDYPCYKGNKFIDMDAVEHLAEIIHVARTKDELFENISHQRIYKPGRAKKDLLHQDGMSLHEVVAEILRRQSLK